MSEDMQPKQSEAPWAVVRVTAVLGEKGWWTPGVLPLDPRAAGISPRYVNWKDAVSQAEGWLSAQPAMPTADGVIYALWNSNTGKLYPIVMTPRLMVVPQPG